MPVISYFFGIYVRMYHNDHAPPHFHVEYQGFEALIAISDGALIEGKLPKRAEQIVREWATTHRVALLSNWAKARALEPLERIPGADYDQNR